MFYSISASSLWANITNYFANFDGVTNTYRTISLWLALALIATFVVCKLAIAKSKQPQVNRVALVVAIEFSVERIVTFGVCGFIDDDMVALTFYPLLVFIICCIVGGLLVAVYPNKKVKIAVAATIGAAFVAVLVCMLVYYATGKASAWNGIELKLSDKIGLYVAAALLAVAVALLAIFADKSHRPFDSHAISFAAICVALSYALSYIRIFKMPMGGSITLASTLPIMLYSYMYGSRKGVFAGLIYGALQALQDPWLLHPAQFLLDYGVAFAGIGVAGCIKDFGLLKGKARAQFALGAVIAGALRFISHYFSGVFAFGTYGAYYAGEYGISALTSPWVYSLVYQSMYVIPDLVITIVVGLILFSSKSFVKQMERYVSKKSAENPAAAPSPAPIAPAEPEPQSK